MKRFIIITLFYLLLSQNNYGQSGTVKSLSTIASGQGGLPASIDLKSFGNAITGLGDLDKDGNNDIVVSCAYSNVEPLVLILFMNNNGTVKSYVEIAKNKGGFTGDISFFDSFGSGITSLGDIDGERIIDFDVQKGR
jgi:hypothetical protein